MPPKVKFSRDAMIDAAVELTREKGIGAVTARELGARLGISARPVFTAFANMEEVHEAVRQRARDIYYNQYLSGFTEYSPAFKRHGMQTISFAQNEPHLFQLLFMYEKENCLSFREALADVMGSVDDVLDVLQKDYNLTRAEAQSLFDHMWIQTYGISVLCAEGICVFSPDEISNLLSEGFIGTLTVLRSEKLKGYVKQAKVEKKPDTPENHTELLQIGKEV